MESATGSLEVASVYTVVYARGAAHIQGLSEQIRGSGDTLNYARSACPALTKSMNWYRAFRTDDLAAAIEKAELIARVGQAKGVCKKCLATARAALSCPGDAQKGTKS